jgi:hypothetical protein
VQESPKHSFRAEIYEQEKDGFYQHSVWLVTPDGKQAEHLVGPEGLTELYPIHIDISPDERWIMWEQKLYHGANALGLYERVSGIRYREIGPPIFSDAAWKFMSEQTAHSFSLPDTVHMIRVSEWPTAGTRTQSLALTGDTETTPVTAPNDHSLVISLNGDDMQTHVDLWFCFYDLEKHRFYLDDAIRKRNKGRVGPSHER